MQLQRAMPILVSEFIDFMSVATPLEPTTPNGRDPANRRFTHSV
jgi:hypothetical protein